MTAPTLVPAAPAVSTAGRGAGPSGAGSADTGPGFASALDDALTGSDTSGRQQAEVSDPATEQPAEQPAGKPTERRPALEDPTDDVADAAAPTIVQPGLWALLSVVQPLPGAAPGAGTDATSAAGPISAAAATAVGPIRAAAATAVGPTGAPGTAALAGAVVTPATSPAVASSAVAAPAAPAVADSAATPSLVLADPTGAALSVVLGTTPGPAAPTPPPAGAPTTVPTNAPTDPALPVPTGDGSGADTSGSSSDDSSDRSGPAAAAAPAPATTDGPVFAVGTAPAAAAVTRPADVIAAPPAGQEPPVASQLGQQLAVLTDAADGSHTMTLVITPDELGPVSIQATVTDGNLDLTLHGAHEHGRHALADALPDLRRELEAAGLSVQRLEVGADAGTSGGTDPWARAAQQQLGDPPSSRQGRPPDTGGRSTTATGDHPGEGTAAQASDLSTSAGVDVRV